MTTRLKLQVNNSGAWKNVAEVPEDHLAEAMAGLDLVGEAAAGGEYFVSFRVLREDERVLADWTYSEGWKIRLPRR